MNKQGWLTRWLTLRAAYNAAVSNDRREQQLGQVAGLALRGAAASASAAPGDSPCAWRLAAAEPTPAHGRPWYPAPSHVS